MQPSPTYGNKDFHTYFHFFRTNSHNLTCKSKQANQIRDLFAEPARNLTPGIYFHVNHNFKKYRRLKSPDGQEKIRKVIKAIATPLTANMKQKHVMCPLAALTNALS